MLFRIQNLEFIRLMDLKKLGVAFVSSFTRMVIKLNTWDATTYIINHASMNGFIFHVFAHFVKKKYTEYQEIRVDLWRFHRALSQAEYSSIIASWAHFLASIPSLIYGRGKCLFFSWSHSHCNLLLISKWKCISRHLNHAVECILYGSLTESWGCGYGKIC